MGRSRRSSGEPAQADVREGEVTLASLKGLAVGVGAIIVVGYLALRTGAAKGLEGLASGITKTIAAPLVGVGGGLSVLGAGVSTFLSPTIAPTIAPKFDWSGWQPFGPSNGSKNGAGNGSRDEDRFGPGNGNGNGGGAGIRTAEYTPRLDSLKTITTAIAKRPEDRPHLRMM